jgi:hypothetical protein
MITNRESLPPPIHDPCRWSPHQKVKRDQRSRWLVCLVHKRPTSNPTGRGPVGPVEEPRDRRACSVVHNRSHGCQCAHATYSRSDAGATRQDGYRALAERRRRCGASPVSDDRLRMWPVSRRVNKTGSGDDDPTLIDEVAAYCVSVFGLRLRRPCSANVRSARGLLLLARRKH